MKQPSVQSIDISTQLACLGIETNFELDCQRLESNFRYVDLLDHMSSTERTKPIVIKPLNNSPMSSTVLEEQLSLMKDVCLRMSLHLLDRNKITSDILSSLDEVVALLSLVRNFILSGIVADGTALRLNAEQLATSCLNLVLAEETIYSRRCLQNFTSLFTLDQSMSRIGDDFLRQIVWKLGYDKLERGTKNGGSSEQTFGEIRRGGVSHPSIQSTEDTQEEKTTSVFDPSMLTSSQAWRVELYHLLSAVSSPMNQAEAIRPVYLSMKTDLLTSLSNAGTGIFGID